jgi:DNA-binding transcriptional MerR regulator
VTTEYTLEELADSVQQWCQERDVFPANGQAAEELTERSIRYYRTLGLLDPPLGNYTKKFTAKHRFQLIALRLYQAQGLPLRKIRDELYGKSLEDLAALEKKASRRGKEAVVVPLQLPVAAESWTVMPLGNDFMLVSRLNKALPRSIIEKINELLQNVAAESEPAAQPNRN